MVSKGRCTRHTIVREKDPEQAKYYGSAEWKRTRAQVRREEPFCRLCKVNPTQVVDHVDGNWRNRSRRNLRGLCGTCNNKRTGAQHAAKRKDR